MKKTNQTCVYQRQERFGSKQRTRQNPSGTPQGCEIVAAYNSDALLYSRYVLDGHSEAKTGTLDVELATRSTTGEVSRYRYYEVPLDVIVRINSSHSVGQTYNELITHGNYRFEKLTLEGPAVDSPELVG